MNAHPDDCSPALREWIQSAGLRVKPFYRVSELAVLLGISPATAKRYAQLGLVDVYSYADHLPGSYIVRVTWAGIEALAAERGIAT